VPPNGKSASGFDFNAAMEAARRDFPQETAKITFIDLSAQDAADKFRDWLLASPHNTKKLTEKLVTENIRKNGFTRLRDTGEIVVAVNPNSASHHLRNPGHEGLFAFHHELGHALTSASLSRVTNGDDILAHVAARHEVAADVFAVLRGIAGGTLTREDAENLSLSRAMAPPGPHATSRALDMLLAEHTDADIKKMTPHAMRDISLVYAELYAPKHGEIEALMKKMQWVRAEEKTAPDAGGGLGQKLKKVFNNILHITPKAAKMTVRRVTEAEWLENVADIFKKAEPGTLEAHTSAKILSSVFNTGKACYPDEKKFDVSDKKWDELRKKFKGPS